MKPNLTEAERRVFGEQAFRDPVTGEIVEVGIGSVHHGAVVKSQIGRVAAGGASCRVAKSDDQT
jgi:hypothetical protein